MIVKPGPVIDFLLANQKVDHPDRIDWQKVSFLFNIIDVYVLVIIQPYWYILTWMFSCSIQAKRALKNLRIRTTPVNSEFKIIGLSDRNCNEQM